MAFMLPIYTCEPFHVGEDSRGERQCVPADVYGSLRQFMTECDIAPGNAEEVSGKWWACLSAPGYMDATEWCGPFDSEAEARAYLADMYDVDPDTGDDASEDGAS